MSAGTEATEAALKLMRMHGQKNLRKILELLLLRVIGMEEQWELK